MMNITVNGIAATCLRWLTITLMAYVSLPLASIADNFDNKDPSVSFDRIDKSDSPGVVKVRAKLHDDDGSIEKVTLLINGNIESEIQKPPFFWDNLLESSHFKDHTFALTLIASDKDGVVSRAETSIRFSNDSEMIVQPRLKESWLCKSLADRGKFILEADMENYRVWGTSPIYDDDGKVHVFYSRWPLEGGSWLVNSEIAHAVADHPEGPYELLGTVLKGRGPGHWDADSIHNPTIHRVDGKYVLLYIGNDASEKDERWDRAYYAHTQRIGMAIADSPYGPWKRSEEPIIDVSPNPKDWDSYCVVNPAFLQHPNGEYWLYYRAWDRNNDNRRKTGLAVAKSLEGPYIKYDKNPVIDFPERGGQTEDPYFFYYDGKFHCLIRDMGNWDWLSGLYLESENGLDWSDYQRGHHKGAHYFPVPDYARYERVQVLFKDGKPEYLFNSIKHDQTSSSAATLKINL